MTEIALRPPSPKAEIRANIERYVLEYLVSQGLKTAWVKPGDVAAFHDLPRGANLRISYGLRNARGFRVIEVLKSRANRNNSTEYQVKVIE